MPNSDRHIDSDHAVSTRPYMVHEPLAGNTALLFAVCSLAMLVVIGLTVDLCHLQVARVDLQQRLERALIAGANGRSGLRSETAVEVFDQTTTGSLAQTTARRFEDDAAGLSGTASAAVPTTLSSVLGIRSIRITATGHAKAPEGRCRNPIMRERDRAGCAVTARSTTETTPQP